MYIAIGNTLNYNKSPTSTTGANIIRDDEANWPWADYGTSNLNWLLLQLYLLAKGLEADFEILGFTGSLGIFHGTQEIGKAGYHRNFYRRMIQST